MMILKTLGVMMIMATIDRCVDGKLLSRPRNTVATVGHLTYFNCSTGEPDGRIQWLKGEQFVYSGDRIVNFDKTRFTVEINDKTGSCNLVIRNVTKEDSGIYGCKDVKDIDCPSVASLTVLEPKTGANTSSAMDTSRILPIFIVLFVASNVAWIICLLQYFLLNKNKRRRNRGMSHEIDVTDDDLLLQTELDELELRSELKAKESELASKTKELKDRKRELENKKRDLKQSERRLEVGKNQLISRKKRLGQRVYANAAGIDTEYVLIIGPDDGSNITEEVMKINLQNPLEMYHVEEVPTYMQQEATAAVHRNTLYVVGLGTYADQIFKYKSKSGWIKCAALKQGRRRHSAAFVDEVLYICGGFVHRDKSVLDSVEAYNGVDNTCKQVGKLSIAVHSSGNCVAYKKSLYIFGGADKDYLYNGYVAISDVQVFDTVQNTCRLLSKPMPSGQLLMCAVLWRESIILLGCRNCFIYDFSTETWQVREQFSTGVYHCGLALSNDRIYVIGGKEEATIAKAKDACRDDVRSVAIGEIIDDKAAHWKVHGRLPRPCYVHAYGVSHENDVTDDDPLLQTELDELQSELKAEESELASKTKELKDRKRELEKKNRDLKQSERRLEVENKQLISRKKRLGERMYASAAGIDADYLLIIGPHDGSNITEEVMKINLQNPSEIHHVEEVPTYMQPEATAAVYHNTVYVVGLGTYSDKIYRYESKSGWNKCASLTLGRRRQSSAFVDEVLYICGGFVHKDKSTLDSVEAYNTVDNTCNSVGKLVIPVHSSGNCVAYKKSLYIFSGGNNDCIAISDLQVFDTVQNKCHLLSNPMPLGILLMRAALWKDSVILLGHRNCFIYDFSTETWQVREQFRTGVFYFGLALSNDRIYVIRGKENATIAKAKDTWTCRDDVRSVAIEEIMDDKPAHWKVHGRLPRPCNVHAYAVVNKKHDEPEEMDFNFQHHSSERNVLENSQEKPYLV